MGRLIARTLLGFTAIGVFALQAPFGAEAKAATVPKTEAEVVAEAQTLEQVSPAQIRTKALVPASGEVAAEKNTKKNTKFLPLVVEPLPKPLSPRPLFQHATYPDAWRAAQKSNRPILVYVSMPNCPYCVKMKQQVYQLPHVKQLVSSSFETIRVGRYTHADLVRKLRIKWYPTTVLVGPNNKILDVIEGYAEANQFRQRLHTGIASLRKKSVTTQLR